MTIFYQIPSTEDLDQIINHESVTAVDFLWAGVVLFGAFVAARLLRRFLRPLLRRIPRLSDESALLISRATGWVVILIGIVYALALIGVDLGPALMVIIILAVIVFFAGRGIIENFASGLVLQGTPMFTVGDEITSDSGTGTVSDITGRTVVLLSPDGELVHIPNKRIIEEPIVNLTDRGSRRSTIPMVVVYGTDLDRAKGVIEEAIADCDGAHIDPAPEALVSEFGDNGITFSLLFWHGPTIMETLRVNDEVSRTVGGALAAHGIQFAFPQRRLWWGSDAPPPEAPGK